MRRVEAVVGADLPVSVWRPLSDVAAFGTTKRTGCTQPVRSSSQCARYATASAAMATRQDSVCSRVRLLSCRTNSRTKSRTSSSR